MLCPSLPLNLLLLPCLPACLIDVRIQFGYFVDTTLEKQLLSLLYADPHIGLLHRGTEKLIEYKTYLQVWVRVSGILGGKNLAVFLSA